MFNLKWFCVVTFMSSYQLVCYGRTLDNITELVPVKNETSSLEIDEDPTNNIYGSLTGVVNKLKPSSCRCVKMFEACGVEMLEDTVVKEEGRSCPSRQRYCCQRETVLMTNDATPDLGGDLKSESTLSDPINLKNTILRDEIFDDESTTTKEPFVYIRPSTLGAILKFLTEGFKFLSNFFD